MGQSDNLCREVYYANIPESGRTLQSRIVPLEVMSEAIQRFRGTFGEPILSVGDFLDTTEKIDVYHGRGGTVILRGDMLDSDVLRMSIEIVHENQSELDKIAETLGLRGYDTN